MSLIFSFLRFKGKPASPKSPPPKGKIDVYHDATNNRIVAMDDEGDDVPIGTGTGSGASTTGDLTTSNGAAAAAAGKLGEIISETVPAEESTGINDNVEGLVSSILLTAGDWDLDGYVAFEATGATATSRGASISQSNNLHGNEVIYSSWPLDNSTTVDTTVLPKTAVRVSSNTYMYLIASAEFSSGTVGAYGRITARRVR
jgi:hypothetical protein